jgi:hypothetical protein
MGVEAGVTSRTLVPSSEAETVNPWWAGTLEGTVAHAIAGEAGWENGELALPMPGVTTSSEPAKVMTARSRNKR